MYNITSVNGHRWATLNKIGTCGRTKTKHRLLKVKAVPFKPAFTFICSYCDLAALKYQNRLFSKHMLVEGGSGDSCIHHQGLPTIKEGLKILNKTIQLSETVLEAISHLSVDTSVNMMVVMFF